MGEYHRFKNVFDLNVDISLFEGDIIRYKADCVVSPSDSKLSGNGGVSLALQNAAGSEIRKEIEKHLSKYHSVEFLEVITTDSYNLSSNYGKILHVVSPSVGYPQDYLSVLGDTIKSILIESFINLKHHSIAMPFIGTGIHRIELEICIESFINGLVKFLEEYEDKLNFNHKYTITFINNKNKDSDRIYSSFQNSLEKITLRSKSYNQSDETNKNDKKNDMKIDDNNVSLDVNEGKKK